MYYYAICVFSTHLIVYIYIYIYIYMPIYITSVDNSKRQLNTIQCVSPLLGMGRGVILARRKP